MANANDEHCSPRIAVSSDDSAASWRGKSRAAVCGPHTAALPPMTITMTSSCPFNLWYSNIYQRFDPTPCRYLERITTGGISPLVVLMRSIPLTRISETRFCTTPGCFHHLRDLDPINKIYLEPQNRSTSRKKGSPSRV